jgi:hypothetical protein
MINMLYLILIAVLIAAIIGYDRVRKTITYYLRTTYPDKWGGYYELLNPPAFRWMQRLSFFADARFLFLEKIEPGDMTMQKLKRKGQIFYGATIVITVIFILLLGFPDLISL